MERNDNICPQTDNQTDTNSKTEAHSYPLWIVGERANTDEIVCVSCNNHFSVNTLIFFTLILFPERNTAEISQ